MDLVNKEEWKKFCYKKLQSHLGAMLIRHNLTDMGDLLDAVWYIASWIELLKDHEHLPAIREDISEKINFLNKKIIKVELLKESDESKQVSAGRLSEMKTIKKKLEEKLQRKSGKGRPNDTRAYRFVAELYMIYKNLPRKANEENRKKAQCYWYEKANEHRGEFYIFLTDFKRILDGLNIIIGKATIKSLADYAAKIIPNKKDQPKYQQQSRSIDFRIMGRPC